MLENGIIFHYVLCMVFFFMLCMLTYNRFIILSDEMNINLFSILASNAVNIDS